MRNAGTAFIILMLAGSVAIAAVMRWYPAALVRSSEKNGGYSHIVWESRVRRVADSALTYYRNALENASSSLTMTADAKQDAYRKSAETAIENILVHDAVRARGLTGETEARIAKKVAEYQSQPNFDIALSLVYGLDESGFVDLIARPEAEREILKEQNGWDDAALAAWLAAEKNAALIVKFTE